VVAASLKKKLVVCYNDEAWITAGDLVDMCAVGGRHVEMLSFDSRRYVGAQIGVHNPKGERVGTVSHLHNTELVLLAGPSGLVRRAIEGMGSPTAVTAPLNVTIR
jgi:adenine-specific DNA-methyltransferase